MSTTTPAAGKVSGTHAADQQGGALAGTWQMVRFMLRRDRIRLPAWVLGLALLMIYFANALGSIIDEQGLAGMAALAASPVTALIGGPGYGFEQLTVPRLLAGLYGLYIMLGTAFMSMTTISRHTRLEEQTGRSELIRANVVGRHAQLTAALIVAVAMNLLVSVLVGLAVIGSTIDPQPDATGAFLLGFSTGAAGIAFAGVAAVTVQLSAYARAGSGIAGAVLGAAFIIRGLGDMSAAQDGDMDWLSWLSPLGWSQQAAPFTLDRWWPLLLSVGFAALCIAVGYTLQSRRDLAAGVLPDKLGSPHAPRWLSSPLALAYRLQRPNLVGWSVAMLLAGVTFGAFTQPMADGVSGMPTEIVEVMGGEGQITEGYLGFMALFFAIMIAVYAILSVQSLRAEEQGVRAEPVLATAVSKPVWLLSWTVVTALGALWLAALAGFGEAITAAAGTGDWDLFVPTLLGHLVHVAAVWFLLGLAVALYGLVPRLVGAAWAVVLYGAFLTLFGEMLEFDEAVLNTSPFQHIGQHPATDISWVSVAVLAALGLVLAGGGAASFRRRDLITA